MRRWCLGDSHSESDVSKSNPTPESELGTVEFASSMDEVDPGESELQLLRLVERGFPKFDLN